MTNAEKSTPWRRIATRKQVVDVIVGLYDEAGQRSYDESVTQTTHAVQAATHAERSGARDPLIVAALLHDIGHLLEPDNYEIRQARDLHHEHLGSRFLANWFPRDVTEPIRHHVTAKRYLCAVDDEYYNTLSPASQRSLDLQGGTFTSDEAAHYESIDCFSDAVLLRRWDDLAKDPHQPHDSIDRYRDLLLRMTAAQNRTE